MDKVRYFLVLLISITLIDSIHTTVTNWNPNDDNDWRWSAQNDTPVRKSNLALGSYNDYDVELEYTSGDGRPKARNEFEQKFLDAEIVNDVIPTFPKKCLKVTYEHDDLIPGQKLTPMEAWDQPEITFESDSDRNLYTIILSCNSKNIPLSSESLPHGFPFDTAGNETVKWLVINIRGSNISAGQCLKNYIPPSRQHSKQVLVRYTFLLYKQKFEIKDDSLSEAVHGDNHRTGEITQSYLFAQEHKLGDPIAANFFIVDW